MSPILRIQLEAGAHHLHMLGPRPTYEFLVEMAEPIGELELLLRQLNNYRRFTPELLRILGADRFPRRLHLVADYRVTGRSE